MTPRMLLISLWILPGTLLLLSAAPRTVSASSLSSSSSSLLPTVVGGATRSVDKKPSLSFLGVQSPSSSSSTQLTDEQQQKEEEGGGGIQVRKRNGQLEPLDRNKIYQRLERLSTDLVIADPNSSPSSSSTAPPPPPPSFGVQLNALTDSILRGMYPNVTTREIDTLAAETAASRATQHVDYAKLAARIWVEQNYKTTPNTFAEAITQLDQTTQYVHPQIVDLVHRRKQEIQNRIVLQRDWEKMTYFGLKTLERSYLLKTDDGQILERPQYLLMRVALGIHCTNTANSNEEYFTPQEETDRLELAFQTYDLMSQGFFSHASPTLFHSGTTHPQLSSCFLVQMSEDSIAGIYDTLKRCAVISKAAGGIGLSVHNIRARKTPIKGTRGVSNGLVPMLRVYDVTSRYVDQGGGKRPGAFAIYLEPWHADILDVLSLKKNHGKEEQRARDLFYGLWVPDLFMKRVENDNVWSLMCPHQCPGLSDCHGAEFEELYCRYENEGRFVRQMRAREIWSAILESQMETGTPYMLYKDAANDKSNQKNLGTIQCSNLCTEIIQYTDAEEVAVCNLASLCLPKYVVSDRGPFGSVDPKSGRAYFDHAELHRVTKIVTRNLNRIIDINSYPVEGAKTSNRRHRPIGIGVSGLADTFIRLGLPFTSDTAKELNEAIFETIYHAALEASLELSEAYGPYDTFAGSPASRGELQYHLWGFHDDALPSQQLATAASNGPSLLHRYAPEWNGKGYDWGDLRKRIMSSGLRNSLLLAPMPTASTSQILGVNECFEPFSSNLYLRRVKAGEFIMANPHLLQDLIDRKLWTPAVRNQLMRDGGSVANIDVIPPRLKEIYKTVWEIKMKSIIDMAADRGKFIDQSQSLNLFIADPNVDKLTAMHFYAWKKGLKTGMYYLRTKPAVNAIQYTVDKHVVGSNVPVVDDAEACVSCQA